ncbi:MAG: hypothetical protein AB7J35_17130 [Dehalococcoidia bacterium]
MEVQLTERAQKRLESLVGPGAYPTAEAAVEAALEALEHPDFEGIDVEALDRQATSARATGTFRELDSAYEAELKTKLDVVLSRHRKP